MTRQKRSGTREHGPKVEICGPTRRVRFKSEGAAKDALTDRLAEKHTAPNKAHRRAESRCYPCRSCGGWHLTSQPKDYRA